MDKIKREETKLGTWPRRLLHVSTLTSCEWQEGNIYNGVKEPQYVAISYTWGRWALRPGEKPEVESIRIQGLDWKIPRIDPDRFTAAELENVIRSITETNRDVQNAYRRTQQWNQQFVVAELYDRVTQTPYAYEVDPNIPPIEFVWLDVACIDQRNYGPFKMYAAQEIGRQHAIFTRATRIYIWLTTQEASAAQQRYDSIRRFARMCVSAQGRGFASDTFESLSDEESAALVADIRNFLSDGWFSSLWTYQEGLISDRAGLLLTRDGNLLLNPIPKFTRSVDPPFKKMYANIDSLIDLETVCNRWWHSTSGPIREKYGQVLQLIDQCGLRTLYKLNEIDAYAAANRRKATFEEDRIYGIQAIFGPDTRLGKTALNDNLGRYFSRRKLEDQLGAKLLTTTNFMAKSQWHTFTKNVAREKRWCVREESVGPAAMSNCALLPEYGVQHCCEFEICRTENDSSCSHVVIFRGRITPLKGFVEVCRSISFEDALQDGSSRDVTCDTEGVQCVHDLFKIIPDAAEELVGLPLPPGEDIERFYECWCKFFREHSIKSTLTDPRDATINWLMANFPDLRLLRIARSFNREHSNEIVNEEDDFDGWFGILLLQYGEGKWTRLGFCEVEITGLDSEVLGGEYWDYLNGEGPMWLATEGIYGAIAEDPWIPDDSSL